MAPSPTSASSATWFAQMRTGFSRQRKTTVPVIAPLATGPSGETLNCNADTAAAVVAGDLRAEKFVLLTDVPGILVPGPDGKLQLLSTATEDEIEQFIRDGTISGGMLPKVRACTNALDAGVHKAHIIDGRIPHAILLEIFTQTGIGTEILGRRVKNTK